MTRVTLKHPTLGTKAFKAASVTELKAEASELWGAPGVVSDGDAVISDSTTLVADQGYTWVLAEVPADAPPPPVDPVVHFKSLLIQARYNKENLNMGAIEFLRRHRLLYMVHATTVEQAVELYEEAKLIPLASTKAHIVAQSGITINGPAFLSTAVESAPASILTAVSDTGVPRMVKLCSQTAQGAAEVANCRALCTGTADAIADDHGCIRADISLFELGPEHDSPAHRPGQYHLIIMPRYVYSLALQLPVREKVIARYLQRLITAVQHVHDHGLVHMDVKGANVFIDMDGDVHLGDFGSAVTLGEPTDSTTVTFTEGWHVWNKDKAANKYDWYMLAVVGAVEVVKEDWADKLVSRERQELCTPMHKLQAVIAGVVDDDLKCMFAQIMALYERN